MLHVTECVDNRNRSVQSHALDGLLRKRAQHNQVHPALQVASHVAQLLARIESLVSLIDKYRRTAEAHHSRLESQPGSQRGLLEEHDNLPARERPTKIRRTRLHDSCEMQNCIDAGGAKVASRDQVWTPEHLRYALGRGRDPALHVAIQL